NDTYKLLVKCGRDVSAGKCACKRGKGSAGGSSDKGKGKLGKDRSEPSKCKRAKQAALFDHEGGLIDHYSKIRQYRQAVLDSNPRSTCHIDLEEKDDGLTYFKRIYVWVLERFPCVRPDHGMPDIQDDETRLARWAKVSKLVGLDKSQQYFPHRVHKQFGYNQDILADVIHLESNEDAWAHYATLLKNEYIYMPSRQFKGHVTVRVDPGAPASGPLLTGSSLLAASSKAREDDERHQESRQDRPDQIMLQHLTREKINHFAVLWVYTDNAYNVVVHKADLGPGVSLVPPSKKASSNAWMTEFKNNQNVHEHEEFIALWLSKYLFPSVKDTVLPDTFALAIHLARGRKMALAPAVLATLYMDLHLLQNTILDLQQGEREFCSKYVPLCITSRFGYWKGFHVRGLVMQFGYNQDIPADVIHLESNEDAWADYATPLENEYIYLPSRQFEGHVTVRLSLLCFSHFSHFAESLLK
nr:serine/threonine-protein phosphatase 7 long form homolog [Tanacetum cinerariifolium]